MKKGWIALALVFLVLPIVLAQDAPYAVDANGKCSTTADGVIIGGYCFDCGKNDGICPDDFSTGTCSSSADIDCCQVSSIKWTDSSGTEITSANGGDSVKLYVETTGKCSGQSVSFDIFEADQFSNDDYSSDPSSTTIGSDGKASASWIADGSVNDGLFGDPEFIFNAVIGNIISYGPSAELAVSGGTTTTTAGVCGDGNLDSGEDPETCASDAGCDNGYVYCGSDEGCQLSCTTNANDNGDSICAADESCSSTACNGLQSTCLNGLVCSNNLCGCVLTPDGVFPPLSSACASVDPDYDFDNDTFMGNDNCPVISNPDQSDFDADASICNFASIPYVSSNGFSCGGDACDLDDDNEGICDPGETSPDCTGSDLCPGTSSAVDLSTVDKDGCTEDQKNCLVQWDCSQAVWSECDESAGTITRDTSLCTFSGPEGSACQTNPVYQPEASKSCLVEEEFPVFSFLNILITLILISGFYILRR